MPDQEKSITRSIDFTVESFDRVMEFATKTNRTFKASAKTLIEQALDSHAENKES